MSEEFFLVILIFSFLNLIFSILFLEMLWPTHFFNQRNQQILRDFTPQTYQTILIKTYKWFFIFKNKFFLKNFK